MKNPFSSPTPVEHEVDGQMFNFYPPRTWTVGKLKGFLKPLFAALATLSQNTETDIGRNQEDHTDPTGSISRKVILTPIDPALARQRSDEKERVVNTLVDNLASQQSLRSLALLVTDSMRDHFDTRLKDGELDQLVNEWSIDQLVAGLMGVAKASKELFAPLMERVGPGLTTLLNPLARVPDEEQHREPPEKETPTPSGENSSSPSSSESASMASESTTS